MKNKILNYFKKTEPKGMQSIVMVTFSVISISIMILLGSLMYLRFSISYKEEIVQNTKTLLEQTGESLEDYLISMRQVSDTIYYNVIKDSDLSNVNREVQNKMNLVYESDKGNLQSIAIYNGSGSLMAAEPVASQKRDPDVTKQEWFVQAMDEVENMHFSTPHIQNLFDDGTHRYYWVISLSRAVELTLGGNSQMGVLLVDMDFSNISRMMNQINASKEGQYYYLCDGNGEIIYHPCQAQLDDGILKENSKTATTYKDGVYDESFEGERRKVIVNTISYTGWKLVGVIPYSTFYHGMVNVRYFFCIILLLMTMMLGVISRTVSVRLSKPILRLNESVKKYEAGEKPEIYIGGSQEVRHLGNSIQKSYEQIDTLMRNIVLEQNERRKSEMDALQSQINPHFLYNTLESITWMIEGKRNDEAVFMISQLAKLFRISLSKGRTVISVKDELQHAQSYMNIQKIRYKDTFSVTFEVDESLYSYCTVKLILQPILENAINYGVSYMDDSGEITIRGKQQDGNLILSVSDNGIGMSEEEVSLLLTDSNRAPKHGSGVGLVNVNNRIRLMFGEEYGLAIESEPDEGTTVSICIPAIPYTEENRKILEKGHMFRKEEVNDMKMQDKNNEES